MHYCHTMSNNLVVKHILHGSDLSYVKILTHIDVLILQVKLCVTYGEQIHYQCFYS